jgi:hypothetical protein
VFVPSLTHNRFTLSQVLAALNRNEYLVARAGRYTIT